MIMIMPTDSSPLNADPLTLLSEKQKLFIESYIVDKNGTKAAIHAGYSAKFAHIEASRMLKRPNVKAAIEAILFQQNKEYRRHLMSKEDFVGKAMDKFESNAVPEAVKPRYLEIGGRALGYIGASADVSTTNNTQINITNKLEINGLSTDQILEKVKGLLDDQSK